MVDNLPCAYVCRAFACNAPTISPAELSQALASAARGT